MPENPAIPALDPPATPQQTLSRERARELQAKSVASRNAAKANSANAAARDAKRRQDEENAKALELQKLRDERIASVPCPPELVSQGLSDVWRGLVGRALDGDASAQREVLAMSGARAAISARLATTQPAGDSAGVSGDSQGVLVRPLPSILDQLAADVGEDIVPDARRLVAELDCGLGEIMRRGRLGLPMSDLEQLAYDVAVQVADEQRIEIIDTPQGPKVSRNAVQTE